MNIPFTALYFASYETAKRATMKHANCEESLLIQGVAGTNLCYVSFGQAELMHIYLESLGNRTQLCISKLSFLKSGLICSSWSCMAR